MTQVNTEKPGPTAKSVELQARIRHAATLKYLANLTDAELAKQLDASVHTIADWKRRPEWNESVKEIANRQMVETCNGVVAMAPFARDVIQELLRKDAPPAIRLKAAQAILRLATGSGF